MADPELEDLRKQCIAKLYLCTDNVSKYFEDEKEEKLAKLKSYLESYCLHEAEQNVLRDVSDKVKNESIASNVDTINRRFTSYMKDMTKKVKVSNHPCMVELNKRIQKGTQVINQNLDESDLTITNTNEAFIDPISKKVFEDPVRNTLCGHTYERTSIMSFISRRKKKTLCPVMGCGNKESVLEEHLIPDDDVRLRLTQMLTLNTNNVEDDNMVISMEY